jgi:hypothetical protein
MVAVAATVLLVKVSTGWQSAWAGGTKTVNGTPAELAKVEEESADWVGRVVNGAADAELHLTKGEVIDNVFHIAKRTCQPVELGYDEGVAGPAGGKRFVQNWPGPIPPSEALIGECLLE